MKKRNVLNLFVLLALLFSVVGCQPAATPAPVATQAAAKPFRVAMVLIGAINDKSWNESGYNGLLKIKNELKVETAYQEKVPLSDTENAMRTFASQGYDLVIGHGDEFSEAGKVVAAEFPNVKFAVVNGANTAPNLMSISMFDEQLAYLTGVIAAMTSKSGKVGFIGGLEIPPVVRNGNGFEMGAKSIKSDITVVKSIIGDFNDAAKGKEATLAMAEQGVDVIYYYVDQAMLGIQEAAKEKNIKLIGCIFDQHELAPDLILTSAIQDTPNAIFLAAKNAKEGNFKGEVKLYGLDSGSLILAPYYDAVPQDVQDKVKQVTQDIISGKIAVPRT
jgi:basic membrane protein A and related proteins